MSDETDKWRLEQLLESDAGSPRARARWQRQLDELTPGEIPSDTTPEPPASPTDPIYLDPSQ